MLIVAPNSVVALAHGGAMYIDAMASSAMRAWPIAQSTEAGGNRPGSGLALEPLFEAGLALNTPTLSWSSVQPSSVVDLRVIEHGDAQRLRGRMTRTDPHAALAFRPMQPDMHAKAAVNARAGQTQIDAIRDRRPRWVTGRTIEARLHMAI
eukprot:364805-Chlamydomonas_euryale.AAC.10